jgi:hypothetical protein
MKLDQFTSAYLQCALFTGTDESNDQGGNPLDGSYSICDFSKEALKKALADCEKFQELNIDDIEAIPDWKGNTDSHGRNIYTQYEVAGHDFWFTRNGHGTGFWDREYLNQETKDKLTKSAKSFGESCVYIGDDGLLYLS